MSEWEKLGCNIMILRAIVKDYNRIDRDAESLLIDQNFNQYKDYCIKKFKLLNVIKLFQNTVNDTYEYLSKNDKNQDEFFYQSYKDMIDQINTEIKLLSNINGIPQE